MANSITVPPLSGPGEATGSRGAPRREAIGYAASVALVALAALAAFIVDHVITAPNLSLVFVLPVIASAVAFGWGPSLVSALLSVAMFDFFFVEPRYTFQVANPTDLWALGLLLVVAAIASTVATESRRRALAAGRAAEQAEALHVLAHAVIRSEPPEAVIGAAAVTLGRIFAAPAVILAETAGKLSPAASSGGGALSPPDQEAAQWSLANGKPTRAETYPFDQAAFDFWPVLTPASRRLVLGVRLADSPRGRPADPERHVELVAGYLAAALAAAAPRSGA
jgi:K+-sensing histidine kinase KdpD